MKLLFAVLHARIAMRLSLRHFVRAEAAALAGDFDAMEHHLAKGRKRKARVERMFDRIEQRLPAHLRAGEALDALDAAEPYLPPADCAEASP